MAVYFGCYHPEMCCFMLLWQEGGGKNDSTASNQIIFRIKVVNYT